MEDVLVFFDFRWFQKNHHFIANRVNDGFLLRFVSGVPIVQYKTVSAPSIIYLMIDKKKIIINIDCDDTIYEQVVSCY